MNKGTKEGTKEEINFTKLLNKQVGKKYLLKINPGFSDKFIYGVHVISKVYGKINQMKILPKADIFLASSEKEISLDFLKSKDFYLDEDDIDKLNLKPIPFTGISVKRPDSKRYQITKMTPSTFQKVFEHYELGAGASIYCTKEKELIKNNLVLEGWHTNWRDFLSYFNLKTKPSIEDLKLIKKQSNKKIANIINEDQKISDFIFKGIGNFEEPYTASWFYEKGTLKRAEKLPFVVTTGSGRSRGDFTIVIKPKN
jgi:hypothetical protein